MSNLYMCKVGNKMLILCPCMAYGVLGRLWIVALEAVELAEG